MSNPDITPWRRSLLFRLSRVVRVGFIGPIMSVAGLSLIVYTPSAAASGECAYTSPQQVSATPDTALDNLFQDYGNAGSGSSWTGGDGTESVALPDGREAWFFSDTFLGKIKNGLRDFKSTRYIHNSIVIEQNGALTGTLYTQPSNHRFAKPSAYVNPVPRNAFKYGFWPGAMVVSGNTLQVIMQEKRFKLGSFTVTPLGDFIAYFQLPSLTLQAVDPLPHNSSIGWGQFAVTDSGYTYIYGASGGNAYAARVVGTSLATPWQYYNGSGWTADVATAVPIGNNVGQHFSVSRIGSAYALITIPSYTENGVMGAFGCSPVGPFGPQQTLYSTPERSMYPSSYNVVSYGAHAHPELTTAPNTLVVSYDVNEERYGPRGVAVENASVYRPRFIDVTLG